MTRQELLAENQNLKAELALSKSEIDTFKKRISALEFKLEQLYKLIRGSRSERFVPEFDASQLSLFPDAPEQSDVEPVKEEITYSRDKKRKHPGRHAIPEHLPIKEVILEPEEDTTGLQKIGNEITETLEYIPASLTKIRTIRPKYAKAHDQGVLIAPMPSRPIDKCMAQASLLAYILVSKYIDHTPFYRQIQRFKREYQWEPPQSTLGDWMSGCCKLLQPLYNTLKQKILSSEYLQADETPIKVLESDKKGSTHQGYQWVYHNPMQKLVLFNYRKGRGQNGPKELLSNFSGYLQCDGYTVYDKISKDLKITLAGCLAHARRKFYDAKNSDPQRAEKALKLFAQMYQKEREIKAQSKDDYALRKTLREREIIPLFEQIRDWITDQQFSILPKSPMGKAMTYFVNQYPKLKAIFDDGRIALDNNLIENAIRPMALGRKNYLFCGSHKAAQDAAMLYSFFGSCKMQNINPMKWLIKTLEKIKEHDQESLELLLPSAKDHKELNQ